MKDRLEMCRPPPPMTAVSDTASVGEKGENAKRRCERAPRRRADLLIAFSSARFQTWIFFQNSID